MGTTTELSSNDTESALFQAVQTALRGLRYGSIEIVVHDAKVVQIERRERVRLGDHKKGSSD